MVFPTLKIHYIFCFYSRSNFLLANDFFSFGFCSTKLEQTFILGLESAIVISTMYNQKRILIYLLLLCNSSTYHKSVVSCNGIAMHLRSPWPLSEF